MTRVLVTLASCENSHLMNAEVQEYPHLMHIGLSEGKCERFLGAGVMMPVMAPGEDIVQLITDFKWANTFHNWTSYVIFMDDSVSLDLENKLHDILSRDSTLAMIRLGDRFVREHQLNIDIYLLLLRGSGNILFYFRKSAGQITTLMGSLPLYELGGKVLVISRKEVTTNFVSAVSYKTVY